MTQADRRYMELYIQRRRLMTQNARDNRDSINILTLKIEALKAVQEVSDEVIRNAPWAPWR